MKARKAWMVLLGLAVLAGGVSPAAAQRPPYGVEEYNTFVETDPQRTPDPAARLQAIDTFLQKYPESILRTFVYRTQAQTAFQLQRYPLCMQAVDGFLEMDRDQVKAFLEQSNLNQTQIDNIYFESLVLYTFSFLQSFRNGTPQADALAAHGAERAREGLALHQKLYGQVDPPADPAVRKQFEDTKLQQEASFRKVLAFVAWRKKDYAAAAREYAGLVRLIPDDATVNYQLGLASLQQPTPDFPAGIWHVARAVALKVNKSDEVKEYLRKVLSGYQQVVPECTTDQLNDVIEAAAQSPTPPPDWRLVDGDRVNALRREMSIKRIFDDLKAGGDAAHIMFLASCGSEIGLGENGQPEMWVLVIDKAESPDNLVTLRVAAGQEAAEAKTANVEVKVVAPLGAKTLKAEDQVRISGKISGFESSPFLIKLTDGQVNAEDIPKPAPARRGGG